MTTELFTVGYEGMVIEDFIEKLKTNKIKLLIDVRETPASRKPGFSKSKLQEWLEHNGIDYVHFKELGSPKDVRNELKETNNFVNFYEQYTKYVQTQATSVKEVENYIRSRKSCLFCFERDYNLCHRSILAKYIKQIYKDIEVKHL